VAHRWLNETRVLDKKNGTVVGLIPMLGPSALSFGLLGSDDSHVLFSIEDASNASGAGSGARVIRAYTAFQDAAYHPTPLVLPGVIDPIAIAATKQHGARFSTRAYTQGLLLVPTPARLKLLHACYQCHSSRMVHSSYRLTL
jgi:hypothetical protein